MKTFIAFDVKHKSILLKVRVLPTVADVHRAHQRGYKRDTSGGVVSAFFVPLRANAKYVGIIVLPSEGLLEEFIPHEVSHAVLHKMSSVNAFEDEEFCTAVGKLTAKIFKKIWAAS